MADVKWIKIVTDIFDDEKILLIESLPEADSIIVIWFKLLCLAGKQNNSGVFAMSNGLPYTDAMLATIFRRKETTVKLALATFEQFGMVKITNDTYTIPNWGKHQNLDSIESKNAYMREYMREYRKKQAQLADGKSNGKSNVSSLDKNKNREEKIRREEDSFLPEAETAPAPKPQPPKDPPVISLVLNDKSEYPIMQTDIDGWKDLYPAVDVMQALRSMKGWLDANPAKRKTKAGIKRFINTWLSREQDKYHQNAQPGNQGGGGNVFMEMYQEEKGRYGTYI